MTPKTGAQLTKTADQPTRWQCLTCEFVVESIRLPFSCTRCGASRVKFVQVKAAAQAAADGEQESAGAGGT